MRWTTLKKRVLDRDPAGRFLLHETGSAWLSSPAPFLKLISVRRAQGAARTSYDSTLAALRFLEEAGEQETEKLLWNHPSLANAAKENSAHKAKQQAIEGAPEKGGQAPQLPLAVLEALEKVVRDTDLPLFHRAYAWYRLFRHWACLRWDDTAGLGPSGLEVRARGVVGQLSRTKTSGPDKKLSALPVFISKDAWVQQEWLFTGLEL